VKELSEKNNSVILVSLVLCLMAVKFVSSGDLL